MNFDFTSVVFDGGGFSGAEFSGGTVGFGRAEFSGGTVGFRNARFCGGWVDFTLAEFCGGEVVFNARFCGGAVVFHSARFSGGAVDFRNARFSGGEVGFRFAEFSGGTVDFRDAKFAGGKVDFDEAKFCGGLVDISTVVDWSFPPAFSWTGTAPSGVRLPNKKDRRRIYRNRVADNYGPGTCKTMWWDRSVKHLPGQHNLVASLSSPRCDVPGEAGRFHAR